MNRNLTLQEKIEKLVSNCFHNIDNNIRQGEQFTRENYEILREQIIGLLEHFENEKVYVLDLPANLIPHPEARRRMVDPELANTPVNKTTIVNTQNFNTFYDLAIKIREDLDNNKEVFIYTIDTVRIFDPVNFNPNFRYIVRSSTIDMEYWYNPEYVEQVNETIQPEQYFERYSNTRTNEKSNKPKSIGDSKLIHKF
jgi:hypothetical protein